MTQEKLPFPVEAGQARIRSRCNPPSLRHPVQSALAELYSQVSICREQTFPLSSPKVRLLRSKFFAYFRLWCQRQFDRIIACFFHGSAVLKSV